MSPYALVFGFVPGVVLIALGVKHGLDKDTYVPSERAQPTPGRHSGSEGEVWASPYSAPRPEPETRTFHDFGTGRIAAGLLCLLLGGLIVAHVYPFAGSEARGTTHVRLPERVLHLGVIGELTRQDQARLTTVLEQEGVDEAGFRAYGTRFPGDPGSLAPFASFPLIAVAGRGDLPDTKIEGGPGGALEGLFSDDGPDDRLGPVQRVDHGPLASKAYCVDLAPVKEPGFACELFGKTFFVIVIDHQAKTLDAAVSDSQEVVAQTVRIKGHPAPDSTQAPERT